MVHCAFRRCFMVAALFLVFPLMGSAVTPDIRLPDWHRVHVQVTDWQPAKGRLEIVVRCSAVVVDLQRLSARIHWPKGFTNASDEQKRARVAASESVELVFSAIAPKHFQGWLEIQISALPNVEQMRAVINATPGLSDLRRLLLLQEAKNLRQPLPIGGSYPLTIDLGLAMLSPGDLLMTPTLDTPHGKAFLWVPEAALGTGSLAKEVQAFRQAVKSGNVSKAEGAAAIVMGLLSNLRDPIPLQKGREESLDLTPETVRQLWQGNLLTLAALRAPRTALADLEGFAPNSGTAQPFLWANVGLFHQLLGQAEQAAAARRQARVMIPAWPGLQP